MAKRSNKYGAKKADCLHGHKHDSKTEAARCNELHDDQATGLISDIIVHPQYYFHINGQPLKHPKGRRIGIKADWAYLDNASGNTVVEDRKGFRTRDYVLRVAIFRACYPEIEFRETRG
ncbi:MAG: DUF1064 domain-containing protein [Alphaproteobacteria bacterium]|nr:MAG: DUF1064 domain-containing protein [Alphaproteobacteria bacterium]